jgi:hypothetical protein
MDYTDWKTCIYNCKEYKNYEMRYCYTNCVVEIRNKTSKRLLKISTKKTGRMVVTLKNDVTKRSETLQVARLIAFTFIDSSEENLNKDTAHLDGDKTNNCIHNLSFVSPLQNKLDNRKHKVNSGSSNSSAKMNDITAFIILKVVEFQRSIQDACNYNTLNFTQKELAEIINVPPAIIYQLSRRCTWIYVDEKSEYQEINKILKELENRLITISKENKKLKEENKELNKKCNILKKNLDKHAKYLAKKANDILKLNNEY